MQVLGGGRCLVHFTPELAKPHTIDIKFNGEAIQGCPFVCKIADTSKIYLSPKLNVFFSELLVQTTDSMAP